RRPARARARRGAGVRAWHRALAAGVRDDAIGRGPLARGRRRARLRGSTDRASAARSRGRAPLPPESRRRARRSGGARRACGGAAQGGGAGRAVLGPERRWRAGKELENGGAGLCVCRDFACKAPVTAPAEVSAMLERMAAERHATRGRALFAARLPGAATPEA